MKVEFLFLVLLATTSISYSQEGVPFSESQKRYLHGNSILIGNNILGDHPTKALMDNTIPNDLVKMQYIDVDNDPNTFSSSEATIANVPANTKIAYAAIYWSALYPCVKGLLKKSGKKMVHEANGERDTDVNQILFKMPNGKYETLKGITIFDSYRKDVFTTNKPYACFADVTGLLQKLPTVNGTYSIANIKATEGEISGGGSAGWLLYVVYEDLEQSAKYFTLYNGLVEVNKEAVEIGFSDFKSKEEGIITTKIALGALEGDRKLKTDEFSIFDKKSGNYKVLSNKLREEKNFFNSSITIGDSVFTDRNPNSTNTLGFDLLKMEIPNDDNDLLDNASTQADLKFQARADRFYLFFVAFETEINNHFLQEKTNSLQSSLASVGTISSSERMDSLIAQVSLSPKITSDKKPAEKILETNQSISSEEALIRKEVRVQTLSVPGIAAGYYLVTNVFSVPENATKWSVFLNERNYSPQTFINPRNQWNYVYIFKNDNPLPVYEKWKQLKGFEYFKEIWIMKINL